MEKPLLRDPQELPQGEVLSQVLLDSYPVFEELMSLLDGFQVDWNYYRDGGAWLCTNRLGNCYHLSWISG
jgi:hypothetical protein